MLPRQMALKVKLLLGVIIIAGNALAQDQSQHLKLPEPLPGVWAAVVAEHPGPFRRKGEQPTYAPTWYANIGEPTMEIGQRPGESDIVAGERLYRTLQN